METLNIGSKIKKLILSGGLAVGLFLTLNACSNSREPAMLSRFESTACKHALAEGSTTRCGYLIVPEDRSEPENGKSIELYVAIYPSLNSGSDDPPLFYLTGGPGASTAEAYNIFEVIDPGDPLYYFRENFGGDRDFIVIDQRGTNYSQPSLYCSDELGPLQSRVYGMAYADAAALRIQALEDCYDRLEEDGVDLSAYDTFENATDIRDMALILGYEEFHLYGASYGTRLAMLTMEHYPDRILSVVIDSILPPEINPFEQATPGMVYAFRTFFDAAEEAYPDLEIRFYEMMDTLDASPVAVTGYHYDSDNNRYDPHTVQVTGVQLAGYLIAELKKTPYNTGLPKTISDMYASGDYGPVADAWISFIDFFFPNGGPGSDSPSVGMYNSVFSAGDAYYTNSEKIEQMIRENITHEGLAEYLRVSYIDMEPGVQGLWPVEPVSFRESDPVESDIPTLMLVGTLDTATPEIFSRPSVQYLSNSFYYPIPAGHATAYLECVCKMLNDFINDPTTAPVNTCATAYQWD